jgi:hypothetical protein
MNNSYILKQLTYLEDAFYDGIDSKLLNHQDLCNFSIQMNTIINNIKTEITKQISNQSNEKINTELNRNDNTYNINYSQLELLGRNNNIKN